MELKWKEQVKTAGNATPALAEVEDNYKLQLAEKDKDKWSNFTIGKLLQREGTYKESRKSSSKENGRSEFPESSEDLTVSQHLLRAKWSCRCGVEIDSQCCSMVICMQHRKPDTEQMVLFTQMKSKGHL
ncbi:tax1-binding protein 1 homolog [Ursus maritimus]|uniref:Tax1-binding protein 1 homolog n=1 Tax=Ursus maritimus TaxID=29073 RepID=A0A8M1FV94_URSMA|nr:tax1-binding protein 1 homolog [Ursus maritimus]